MKKSLARIAIFAMATMGLSIPVAPAIASPVTLEASNSSLKHSNTSRKIVVASNGDIFALYHKSGTGVLVARSTDGGSSFSAGVTVDGTSEEAELAISNSGVLYVTWATGTKVYQKRSTDSGATWGSAVEVATYNSPPVHTAVDREYVYVIPKNGAKVFSSADSGDVWRDVDLSSVTWVYSDVVVDPLSGRVYAFVDNPSVSWFYSDDRGLTFSEEQETGKEIYYSVSAISSSPTSKFMFMVGGAALTTEPSKNIVRLNLSTGAVDSYSSLNEMDTNDTRSIAADNMGNLVVGGVNAGDFFFQVSNDYGVTFGSNQVVQAGIGPHYGSVTINPTNGDVLALWDDNGAIKFQKFSDLLVGYDLNLDVAALDFDTAGNKAIVLTNKSVSAITVSEISLSNTSDFSMTNDCSAALNQNDTCTITVTASSAGSAILTIKATGGIERYIPVAFGASSATVDLPEVTADGDAPAAVPYTGPIVKPLSAPTSSGTTVVLTGSTLSGITKATIDGKDAIVKVLSDTQIQITIPAGLSGTYDLIVVSGNGTLTVQSAIVVSGSPSAATGAGTKRSGDSFRVYFFDPVAKGKVQFFVNGKEIAWVNATSASDSKLRSVVKNGVDTNYLVRTVDLEPGKNIVEVLVDGERVKRVAYTR